MSDQEIGRDTESDQLIDGFDSNEHVVKGASDVTDDSTNRAQSNPVESTGGQSDSEHSPIESSDQHCEPSHDSLSCPDSVKVRHLNVTIIGISIKLFIFIF